jgi:GWxTD domain-containing protein
MFKYIFFLILLFSGISYGQTQKVRAYLDEKQFYAPEVGNYIEIQLQFVGYSLKYKGVDGGLMGELAIRMNVKLQDSIVARDAYRLQTPLMRDSIIDDFYDLKRFALKPGNYVLEIELEDLNTTGESIKANKPFIVEDLANKLAISDIQISEVVTKGDNSSVFFKSGYNLIPRLSTFYPSEITKLPLYLEIYNSKLIGDSVFGVKQTITDVLTGKEIESMTVFTRHKVSEVIPILRPVIIEDLPTGKYTLDYSIINRDLKELATKSYEFERSNDVVEAFDPNAIIIDPAFQTSITDDSLTFYLASLIPMARPAEVKNILSVLKSKNNESARKHIQAFWFATAKTNYYEAWLKYKAQVLVVEKLYRNNFQSGFETDRGRVYLQYGSPSMVVQKEVSSTEYPYEIWQYNKIGKFSNKRFIFYNPDLVNNGYRLLHSDMIGELKNASWQLVLNKRNTTNGNIDDPNQHIQQSYGGNSNYNFRQY